MDRALDSDSESQGFDSLHAYNKVKTVVLKIFGTVLVSTFKIC